MENSSGNHGTVLACDRFYCTCLRYSGKYLSSLNNTLQGIIIKNHNTDQTDHTNQFKPAVTKNITILKSDTFPFGTG